MKQARFMGGAGRQASPERTKMTNLQTRLSEILQDYPKVMANGFATALSCFASSRYASRPSGLQSTFARSL